MEGQTVRYLSPVKKLAGFFEKSRDPWKAKIVPLRCALRIAKNQIRAVEKSREEWRQKAEQASAEAQSVRAELDELRAVKKK